MGPWLPEPLVTGEPLLTAEPAADAAERTESVSMALLVVLVFVGDRLFSVLVVEPSEDGERVSDIYAITNPEKLAGAASTAL